MFQSRSRRKRLTLKRFVLFPLAMGACFACITFGISSCVMPAEDDCPIVAREWYGQVLLGVSSTDVNIVWFKLIFALRDSCGLFWERVSSSIYGSAAIRADLGRYCLSAGHCLSLPEIYDIWYTPGDPAAAMFPCQEKKVAAYRPSFRFRDVALLLELIDVFLDTVKSINATFFLHGGSLLGALRHHGAIPWDDDFDVMVDVRKRELLESALQNRGPSYRVGGHLNGRFKFYSLKGTPIRNVVPGLFATHRWPFIDLFFYNSTNSAVWGTDPSYTFLHNTSDIFPLEFKPFFGMWWPVPLNSAKMCEGDMDLCVSRSYCHLQDNFVPDMYTAPCGAFTSFYPFVYRELLVNGVSKETLKKADQRIYSLDMANMHGRKAGHHEEEISEPTHWLKN